jgi:hypothetical protein
MDTFSMIDLDATDLRLLDLLQTDASLSNQDLAARAHTSPATACGVCGGWSTPASSNAAWRCCRPRRWARG